MEDALATLIRGKSACHAQGGHAFPIPFSEPRATPMPLSQPSSPGENALIPAELALEIRRIAHDLSNSLEIIVQTSYLLSMAELKEPATEWLRMLDAGVAKALEQNLQLREYLKQHTPR